MQIDWLPLGIMYPPWPDGLNDNASGWPCVRREIRKGERDSPQKCVTRIRACKVLVSSHLKNSISRNRSMMYQDVVLNE